MAVGVREPDSHAKPLLEGDPSSAYDAGYYTYRAFSASSSNDASMAATAAVTSAAFFVK